MAEMLVKEELTVATDLVVTKYKMAAEIVNDIVKKIAVKCVAGAKIPELCEYGDQLVVDETAKVFKKDKEMKKGIAFPTCISVNNCICHYSPLKSDPEIELKDDDVVKIDVGAHIDGFCAVLAHTIVVGASSDKKVKGRKADAILAAYYAAEAALRLVKPGGENYVVTEAIQTVAESYQCKPIEGILSHKLKQHVMDREKGIVQNPTEAHRRDRECCEFDVHEVYAIDILISTGEGKIKEQDTRTTTVFKKKEMIYNLKMKASRQFFSEMRKRFSTMPFTLRAFEDEKKARMGVIECVKHHLVEPFNVLYEKGDTEVVAQFKFTVLLMPNGPMKITGQPFDTSMYESEYAVEDEELKAVLAQSTSRNAAKKKKMKAKKQLVANLATTVNEAKKPEKQKSLWELLDGYEVVQVPEPPKEEEKPKKEKKEKEEKKEEKKKEEGKAEDGEAKAAEGQDGEKKEGEEKDEEKQDEKKKEEKKDEEEKKEEAKERMYMYSL